MIIKNTTTLLFYLLIPFIMQGQDNPVRAGKIEYEVKYNYHKYLKNEYPEWYEQIKDKTSKHIITYQDLLFDSSVSVYIPGREPDQKNPFSWEEIAEYYIYCNWATQLYISQKPIYEKFFLVSDSIKKIQWRLHPETRDILGFSCNKATAIINDSIYLIAFYTDHIICQSGPEGIGGLPGMILGLVIPRIHTTWFATGINRITPGDIKKMKPPVKGEKCNRQQLQNRVGEILKDWNINLKIRTLL